jgi:hypothetical protein
MELDCFTRLRALKLFEKETGAKDKISHCNEREGRTLDKDYFIVNKNA